MILHDWRKKENLQGRIRTSSRDSQTVILNLGLEAEGLILDLEVKIWRKWEEQMLIGQAGPMILIVKRTLFLLVLKKW